MGLVYIEGKPVTIPDVVINAGIEAIRAALSVDFPQAASAEITIATPATVGAPRIATVVKRGDGKGNGSRLPFNEREVVEVLAAAPAYVNPAMVLAARLQQDETRGDQEAVERAIRSGEAERAITEGEREGLAVQRALAVCGHACPVASIDVPTGF